MEELEEEYEQSIRDLDNKFLEDLRSGKNKKELKKEYIKNLHKIREDYFAKLKEKLKKEKIYKPNNKIFFFNKRDFKRFKNVRSEQKNSFFNSLKLNFSIFLFILKRKIRSIFSSIIPFRIKYFFYYKKIFFNRKKKEFFFILAEKKRKIKNFLSSLSFKNKTSVENTEKTNLKILG